MQMMQKPMLSEEQGPYPRCIRTPDDVGVADGPDSLLIAPRALRDPLAQELRSRCREQELNFFEFSIHVAISSPNGSRAKLRATLTAQLTAWFRRSRVTQVGNGGLWRGLVKRRCARHALRIVRFAGESVGRSEAGCGLADAPGGLAGG